MIILGDVHGDIQFCKQFALGNPTQTIVQLGDLGVGTINSLGGIFDETHIIAGAFVAPRIIKMLPSNFYFFVGNHDNRDEAIKLTNCLGHYGEFENIFFVSGADSYDKDTRTEGVTWWSNEELSYEQASDCLEKWQNSKSEILVCHDIPQSFAEGFYLIYDRSLTRNLLENMIRARKPKKVISGHHHKALRVNVNGIEWISLGIGEDYELLDV